MSWILATAAEGLLVLVFLASASHKLRDFPRFEASLGAYELVSVAWLPPMAALVVILELIAIAALLAPGTAGALLALGLLAGYSTAIGINLHRGIRSIDCGCGDVPTPLSGALIWRNGTLMGFGILAILLDPTAGATVWSDWLLVASIAAVLMLLYSIAEQLLANHHQLMENPMMSGGHAGG